jgi:hypothetical protein
MENLLRLSGLLSEDDNGATDLGMLEKRLAERDSSRRASIAAGNDSNPNTPSLGNDATPTADSFSPKTALTSPEPEKNGDKNHKDNPEEKETERTAEEVEDLSDMMCSLVTNNCGETRYIGKSH